MTKKQRINYFIREALARNGAGAARNTDIIQWADKFHLSTAAAGQLRAEVIFVGPPTRRFW